VPVFSAGDEDNTVFDTVEHGGLVYLKTKSIVRYKIQTLLLCEHTFEFAFVLTKVMMVSIHNSITSFLQETEVQVHL